MICDKCDHKNVCQFTAHMVNAETCIHFKPNPTCRTSTEIVHAKITLLPHCSKCGALLRKVGMKEYSRVVDGVMVSTMKPTPSVCPECKAVFDVIELEKIPMQIEEESKNISMSMK